MDHWGDPWADDADTDAHAHQLTHETSTPNATVAEPSAPPGAALTPKFKPAPIALNGFLDDAGWGSSDAWATTPSPRKDVDEQGLSEGVSQKMNWATHAEKEDGQTIEEDERFSAWATAPGEDVSADGSLNGSRHSEGWGTQPDCVDTARLEDGVGNEWGGIEEAVEGSKGAEHGVSEASDEATTIHADDPPAQIDAATVAELPREDDASTRSTESRSDGSNEAVGESPRTSVEEERTVSKNVMDARADVKQPEGVTSSTEPVEEVNGVEDDFGEFEDDVAQEADEAQPDAQTISNRPEPLSDENQEAVREAPATSIPKGPIGTYILDSTLLEALFPPVKESSQVEEAPEDPVSSTSTRKAWYRLTRRQTMREYNTGAIDDNYVRVTWKTSNIKSEAVKTVARWATEDRMAGRGPGARASFFWDTPHSPTDKRASFASLHSRKTSVISASRPSRPPSQVVPPLSTDAPAAFDWSSPSSATPATPDTLGIRSTSSPIAAKHSTIAKLQKQTRRAASIDLSPSPRVVSSHRRTSTTTGLHNDPPAATPVITPIEAPPRVSFDPWSSTTTSSPITPIPAQPAGKIDPWSSLGVLDTGSSVQAPSAAPDDDDDDEWGEMVESPAVSTMRTPSSTLHTPVADTAEQPTHNHNTPTNPTTPASARSSPLQPLPPPTGPAHASPIVRLKGVVSPTSAIFGAKPLVPSESDERIGPHLLKKRDRSREATPEKPKAAPVLMSAMDEVLSQPPAQHSIEESIHHEDSVAETHPPPSISPETEIPPHSNDDFPNVDDVHAQLPPSDEPNWGGDADFSIFESAPPPPSYAAPSTAAPTNTSHSDPADPWSFFDTPVPPEPFVRPVARPATPPTKQPLTSATNSAQRRKVEEDDVVRGIVEGLPDLGYMLRR